MSHDVEEKNQTITGSVGGTNFHMIGPNTNYREYCRPKLNDMLHSLKLDIPYFKAKGNYLYYNKVSDKGIHEVSVLDFVGGYGANFIGHNHPELKETLKACLDRDMPNLSQCSVRIVTAELAGKLNELIPGKGKYVCNFTNSGTESVEAAIKHAFRIRTDIIQRKYDSISTKLNAMLDRLHLENSGFRLPDGYENLPALIDEIKKHNELELSTYLDNPVICALKGAFHGKTTSSLKVTYNKTFREVYEGMSALKSVFIDIDKPEQLAELASKNQLSFKYLEIEDETVLIKTWETCRIFACIMEVILGEGGILILPEKVLFDFVTLHNRLNIPFIIDEIQTGCGRTGSFFAFEQTPLSLIEPEYVTLSKALGGGLSKIGVTMIHEKEYDPEFGLVHTSTFAEDDMSASIGLKVVEMLTRDNNKLMRKAKVMGKYIVNKLKMLQDKYPDIIKEVRGRGLMIGIEFTELNNYGPFFRYAGSQGFIALLMASYVLHYHDIRIISPLTTMFKGNPGKKRSPVIRIQPSVYITEDEIKQLIRALDEVLNIIASNNEYVLLAHLFDKGLDSEMRLSPKQFPVIYPEQKPPTDIHKRIGFIGHVTELRYLIEYYLPSFEHYEFRRRDLIKWWDKLSRFLDPDLMRRIYITTKNKTIEANIVCVPYLPKYMIKTYVEGHNYAENEYDKKFLLLDMQDKIQDALTKAHDLGDKNVPVNIAGLGAYTSIVTDNGLAVNDKEAAVTTGNAFTTALVFMGVCEAVNQQKRDMNNLTAAIVGASGNIGSALTYLIGAEVKKLHIIGRDKIISYDRLAKAREHCLSRILENIRLQLKSAASEDDIKLRGFSEKIYMDIIKPLLKQPPDHETLQSYMLDEINGEKLVSLRSGRILNDLINSHYQTKENQFIEISELSSIKDCDIIVIATNSSDAWLINPDDVKPGAIVCCASVPSNLSESFKDKTDQFFVFDGGYALLPEKNEINFVGMPKHGNVYGCIAETLLLGLEGDTKSAVRGTISISNITKIIELADKHEFKLGKFLLGDDIQRMVT